LRFNKYFPSLGKDFIDFEHRVLNKGRLVGLSPKGKGEKIK
jgi:hypothetical protein